MASTPSKTLLECKGFSGEAGGNWTAEKDKEFDVLHLEHTLQRHRDQKREGTDPSVNTWISDGGREDSPLEAIWSRDVLLPGAVGMKGKH